MLHNNECNNDEQVIALTKIALTKDTQSLSDAADLAVDQTDDHSDELAALVSEGFGLGIKATERNTHVFLIDLIERNEGNLFWFMGSFEEVKKKIEDCDDLVATEE